MPVNDYSLQSGSLTQYTSYTITSYTIHIIWNTHHPEYTSSGTHIIRNTHHPEYTSSGSRILFL